MPVANRTKYGRESLVQARCGRREGDPALETLNRIDQREKRTRQGRSTCGIAGRNLSKVWTREELMPD